MVSDRLICFGVLGMISILDVFMTKWQMDFCNSHKGMLRSYAMELADYPERMEVNLIPGLIIKHKLPTLVWYLVPLAFLGIGMSIISNPMTMLIFMLGAYFIVVQIHIHNITGYVQIAAKQDKKEVISDGKEGAETQG